MVPLFGKQFVSIKGIQALITGTEYLDTAYWTPTLLPGVQGPNRGGQRQSSKSRGESPNLYL